MADHHGAVAFGVALNSNYCSNVTELKQDFARFYVEFEDPADDENILRCDLTWLTSNWHCIWGNGCGGIKKGFPQYGCCADGAHFTERSDERRVAKFVKLLTPETWANHKQGQDGKWIEVDEDGDRKTRVYKNGCIFLNPVDWPAGGGCALHHEAARQKTTIIETKPEVCWQLPIRRDYNWRTYEDGEKKLIITIEEYQRSGWGPGGHDLHWYCSSNTDAHTASEPVYVSEKNTLIELMGPKAYAVLVKHCEARIEMLNTAREIAKKTRDPKQVRKVMLSLGSHPATEANL